MEKNDYIKNQSDVIRNDVQVMNCGQLSAGYLITSHSAMGSAAQGYDISLMPHSNSDHINQLILNQPHGTSWYVDENNQAVRGQMAANGREVHVGQRSSFVGQRSNSLEIRLGNTMKKQDSVEQDQTESGNFTCTVCGKCYKYKQYLLKHERIHMGDLPYNCEYCTKRFTSASERTTHMRLHTNDRPFKCQQCGKSFRQSGALTMHMRFHSDYRPFACPHCPARFFCNPDLKKHVKCTHDKIRDFECGICGQKFLLNATLVSHERSHLGIKPYECKQCQRRFSRLSQLRLHEFTHSDVREFACDQCNKRYPCESLLQRHVRMSHDQKNEFTCDMCDKGFPVLYQLKNHKKYKHDNERPYCCLQCNKTFHTKSHLHSHSRVHLEEKEFKCYACPKQFHKTSALALHYQRDHSVSVSLDQLVEDPVKNVTQSYMPVITNIYSDLVDSGVELMRENNSKESKDYRYSKVKNIGAKKKKLLSECNEDDCFNSYDVDCNDDDSMSVVLDHMTGELREIKSFNLNNKKSKKVKNNKNSKSDKTHLSAATLSTSSEKDIHSINSETTNTRSTIISKGKELFETSSSNTEIVTDGQNTMDRELITDNGDNSMHDNNVDNNQVLVSEVPYNENGNTYSGETINGTEDIDTSRFNSSDVVLLDSADGGTYFVCGSEGAQEIYIDGEAAVVSLDQLLALLNQKASEKNSNQTFSAENSLKDSLYSSETCNKINTNQMLNKKSPSNIKVDDREKKTDNNKLNSDNSDRNSVIYYDPPSDADVEDSSMNKELVYKCDRCDKTYRRKSYLASHQRIHATGSDATASDQNMNCKYCDEIFSSDHSLTVHINSEHSGAKKPYVCCYCKQAYRTLAHLKSHKLSHTDVRAFVCKHCGKRFKHASTARMHARIHSTKRPYSCSHCNLSFKQSGTLKSHELIHQGIRPFRCKTCGADFYRRYALQEHERVHRDWAFKCDVCGYAYPQKSVLIRHMMTHNTGDELNKGVNKGTGEGGGGGVRISRRIAPVRTLQRFPRRSSLIPRSLDCSVCGKQFSRLAHLRVHEKSHGEEKPWHCLLCRKKYADQSQLSRHTKLVHGPRNRGKKYVEEKLVNTMASKLLEKSLMNVEQEFDDDSLYECGVCCAQFRLLAVLRRHIRVMHSCQETNSSLQVDKNSDVQEVLLSNLQSSASVNSVTESSGNEGHKEMKEDQINSSGESELSGENESSQSGVDKKELRTGYSINTRSSNRIKQNSATSSSSISHFCSKCHSIFKSLPELQAHDCSLDVDKNCDKNYECMLCGNHYNMKASLARHLRRAHNTSSLTRCRVQSQTLQTDERPVICSDTVSLPEIQEQDLSVFIINKKKMLKCQQCELLFNDLDNLKAHMFKHAGEKRPYKCAYCSRRYATKGCWRQHIPHHKKELRLTCQTCGKKFLRMDTLMQHKLLHVNSRPYECELCNKSYLYSDGLRRHLKSAHPNHEPSSSSVKSVKSNVGKQNKTVTISNEIKSSNKNQIITSSMKLSERMKEELLQMLMLEEEEVDRKDSVICDVCNQEFPSIHMLAEHLTAEHYQIPDDNDTSCNNT